jgi:hypothetical protein
LDMKIETTMLCLWDCNIKKQHMMGSAKPYSIQ